MWSVVAAARQAARTTCRRSDVDVGSLAVSVLGGGNAKAATAAAIVGGRSEDQRGRESQPGEIGAEEGGNWVIRRKGRATGSGDAREGKKAAG